MIRIKGIGKHTFMTVFSIAMVFTMMPLIPEAAEYVNAASGDPAINLVRNGEAPQISGGGGTKDGTVWYGNYPQSAYSPKTVPSSPERGEICVDSDGTIFKCSNGDTIDYCKVEPVKWRVLSNSGKKLFLLSDTNLDVNSHLRPYGPYTWEDSMIRAWLNCRKHTDFFDYTYSGFYKNAFSYEERRAIATTTVVNESVGNAEGGNDTEGKLFLLSFADACNEDYGFSSDCDKETPERLAMNTAYVKEGGESGCDDLITGKKGDWWLRTTGCGLTEPGRNMFVTFVYFRGSVNPFGDRSDARMPIRPAMNLDLNSVIFTSAAMGGKTSAGVGPNSLKKVGKSSTDQWKFTVRDTYRNEFSISDVTVTGYAMLQMNYSGAAVDSRECPERISAIVVGSKGNIKYYGNIATPVSPGGTATINLDGKFDQKAGDKLYVFNEQLGGDKKTDYSSELKEINVPPLESRPARVSILTLKAGRKKVTVRWKKASGGVYYQVGYRLKGSKIWRYTTSKTTYKTIKKLKSRKYCYVGSMKFFL